MKECKNLSLTGVGMEKGREGGGEEEEEREGGKGGAEVRKRSNLRTMRKVGSCGGK